MQYILGRVFVSPTNAQPETSSYPRMSTELTRRQLLSVGMKPPVQWIQHTGNYVIYKGHIILLK